MKKLLFIFVAAAALLSCGSAFASKITNVELSHDDGFTIARINVEGTIRFTHQTEEAKEGKPFRVIVDILSATHQLGAYNFMQLPLCPVKSIRSSQYSIKPEKIVRIVFDMDNEKVYRIESDSKYIFLFFFDKSTEHFTSWSTAMTVAANSKNAKESSTRAEKKEKINAAFALNNNEKTRTTEELNNKINNDRMLSLKSSSSTSPSSAKKIPSVSESNVTTKKTVKKAPVSSTPQDVKKSSVKVVTSDVPYGPYVEHSLAEKKRQKESKPETSSPVKSTVKKASIDDKSKFTKTSTKPKDVKLAVVTDTKTATTKTPPVMKPATKKETTTKKKVTTKKKSQKQKKTKFVKKSEPIKKSNTKAENKNKTTKAAQNKKSSSKTKSTARFRRSPVSSKKIRGTLVAEFPKRLVIKYKTKLYRDPFETLINDTKVYNSPVEKRVPNVEGLKLVGIIESGTKKDNRALFEDNEGYGYILKTGDKVRKGYVLRVANNKVYFQIFEYGWSRTVALNLES